MFELLIQAAASAPFRLSRPHGIRSTGVMDAAVQKRDGVHYTPEKLARFLARQTARHAAGWINGEFPVRILDPACGDGELLIALLESLPCPASRVHVSGFEKDQTAADQAATRIAGQGVASCQIDCDDFLQTAGDVCGPNAFDIIIANPPYVRTQVLGAKAARGLAKRHGLSGRVDLYQAFALAMMEVLRPGGALGLLASNRFLTVKSGARLRSRLIQDFEIRDVFDLGDTKLFGAAVLPVIITAVKKSDPASVHDTRFHRVYRCPLARRQDFKQAADVLDALDDQTSSGHVKCEAGEFLIERGNLNDDAGQAVWTLENSQTRDWLKQIRAYRIGTFGDLAEVKVGIKTTADSVFIRESWSDLAPESSPESALVHPLITHHDSGRWRIPGKTCKSVLYPYQLDALRRQPVDLQAFPLAAAYLETHRQRLAGRKYVADAGRDWFEIWVAHQPADWAKPKIVWPDISAQPRFFLDASGAIVNGDCYWIKLRSGVDPDWLYVMLAVANSTIATTFYDTVFHNKLYAGRRRFMTQYVKEFPLPALDSKLGQQIVRTVRQLVEGPTEALEAEIEFLVRDSFGM